MTLSVFQLLGPQLPHHLWRVEWQGPLPAQWTVSEFELFACAMTRCAAGNQPDMQRAGWVWEILPPTPDGEAIMRVLLGEMLATSEPLPIAGAARTLGWDIQQGYSRELDLDRAASHACVSIDIRR
jgi:hypothetical protein